LTSTIAKALDYWLRATIRPRHAFRALIAESEPVGIALWVNLIFAALYAVTALVYYTIGRLPAVEPWMPIAPESYYLYQVFWTVPWGLLTWIAFSGVAHLLAVAGRPAPRPGQFEDGLTVCGLAWVVPSAVLMWVPETILVPVFGVFWPAWLETLRLMVIPPVWQTLLVAVGLRETHQIGWLRGIGIGIVTVLVFFISFLAYMR
jgi:hypothetical protein